MTSHIRVAATPLVLLLLVVLSSCSYVGNAGSSDVSHTDNGHASEGDLHAIIDETAIPLGDGRATTTRPTEPGYLFVCTIASGGGGAFFSPWVGETTWDKTQKVTVDGENYYSDATSSFRADGELRVISTNGLPVDNPSGNFPIATSDDAYAYDRNPHRVQAQSATVSIPRNPVVADQPSCTPMGAIGVAVNGVAIFNAIDGESRDAVAHEVQDVCDGHPERSGTYHYHNGSACLTEQAPSGQATLIGYALDGFGIFAEKDRAGNLKTNADLDVCHGLTSVVPWNGKTQSVYHYSVTVEFPYTVGCFMGTPVTLTTQQTGGGQSPPQGPPPGGPPTGGPPRG